MNRRMNETKPKKWSKAWRDTWIDDASVELDLCAIALRQYLAQHVGRVDDDGTGWATTDKGAPVTPARMALILKTPLAVVHASLERLRQAGIAVERGGEWGTVGWTATQELPEATRQRKYREARSGVTENVTVTPDVTVGVPASGQKPVTANTTVTPRGTEEQRNRITLPPPAGVREDYPPVAGHCATDANPNPNPNSPTAPPEIQRPICERLARARELVGTYTQATAAARADMPQGRLKHLEAGVLLPTRDDLLRLSRAYGQPEIAAWDIPVLDQEIIAAVVTLHRDLAVELGALAQNAHAISSERMAADIYATEAADLATGLTLRQAWERVLRRAAEELRREIARGRQNGRAFFTIRGLAGSDRRAKYLALEDLDRRDDLPPRTSRRGPAPPQNPDRLTTGEIPT